MKKYWNQKLERALAFVLSVLLVVNSIPLAGVSIAATNESEESNETPCSVSVIYGTEKWENLVAGIPLTPEMFGVDLTAASKEEDETVETTTADETSEAAEPVAGDESDDESSATDTTSSADDQGETETTSSADDQGATETTSSADDQGATETTSSADDQGATETTSSADDQGATDTTSSADDQGATDTTSSADNQSATIASDANDGQNATVESGSDDSQSETEESDSADGQSVVVAPKYADAQSAGENGNNQTSGTSGETGGESSSSATEETSSDATEDQSEEAEEADVYSYFEVSQGVKEDGTPILSGLIELSGDNNEYLKVLSGENKVGTAVIGIQKNGDTIEGCTYKVSVKWADLPDNLVFEDVNGIFVPEDIYNVEFKNWLNISAEGWEVSERNLNSWQKLADWTWKNAYNNDSRDVYFRYIENGDLKGGIAKYTITVNSTYDVSEPTVAFYSIDGKFTYEYEKLYCFEETEGKKVNVVITVQDANFAIADGHASHVSFYFDKFDKDNLTTNLLESTFVDQVETEWGVEGYSFDVILPADDQEEHTLIAAVFDDCANVTGEELDGKAFQHISITITYGFSDSDLLNEFSGDGTTILNDNPTIRCKIEGSIAREKISCNFTSRAWEGGATSTTDGLKDNFIPAGENANYIDFVYQGYLLDWDNNVFELTCEDDYGHNLTKQIKFISDRTNPVLDVSVKPATEDDKVNFADKQYHTNNAKAIFSIVEDNFDEEKTKVMIQKEGSEKVEPLSCTWGSTQVDGKKVWTSEIDLSTYEEGRYFLFVESEDKAGHSLAEPAIHDLSFAKEVNGKIIAIKPIVIDRSVPTIEYYFVFKDQAYFGNKTRRFNDKATLVVKAWDAYSPIQSITVTDASSGFYRDILPHVSDVSHNQDGSWEYQTEIEVPVKELGPDYQPIMKFTMFASDVLGHVTEKETSGEVKWDSIAPVLTVEHLQPYDSHPEGYTDDGESGENGENGASQQENVPIAFCQNDALTDTLKIKIADKDFDVHELHIFINDIELKLALKENEASETESEKTTDENADNADEGKVYYVVEETDSQGVGTGVWVVENVQIVGGEEGVPIRILYADPAENLLVAADSDKFSKVCLDGVLSYSQTLPQIEIESWTTPKTPEPTVEYGYPIVGGKVKQRIKITGHNVEKESIKAFLISNPGTEDECETELSYYNYSHPWGSGVRSFDLIYDCPDGPYDIVIKCRDTHTLNGLFKYRILVDSTAPASKDLGYKPAVRVVDTNDDGEVDIRYYADVTSVDIGAEDLTTKITQLYYELMDSGNEVISGKSPAKSAKFSEDQKSVSAEIILPETGDGEFDGKIRYWARNEFGLEDEAKAITTQRIIVDKTNPVFSFDFDKKLTMREGVLFCKEQTNLVLTVKEKYFEPKEVSIMLKVDDGKYESKEYNWDEVGKGSGVWTCTIPMQENADYNVIVNYHDRSGNPMILGDGMKDDNRLMSVDEEKGEFQFRQVTVDTLSPITCLEIIETPAVSEKDQPEYYTQKDGVKVVAHVFEKHFVPMLVTIDVSAIDVEGKTIKIDDKEVQEYYQKLIHDPKNWKDGEEDNEHVITLPVSVDARYYMKISCLDPAENQNVYVGESLKNYKNDLDFVLDRTNPDKVLVTYSKQKSGEHGETMYYQDQVKVVLQTKDDISGIREIRYLFIPNGQDGEKSADDLEKSLPNHDFGKIGEGMSAFEATIYLPESALDEKNQLNGYLRVKAVSGSKAETFHVEGTRLVVDNIAPEMVGDMQYSPAHTTKDKKYYFQDTVTCLAQILEANFIASDVVLTINGKTEAQTADGWKKDAKNKNLYRHEFNLPTEGDYDITMTYTDQSGNKMKDFVSPTLVVDKTDPVITAEVSAAGAVNEEGGIRYYSSNQSLIVTVREHNFDPDAVKVNVTAFGVDGRTVLTEEHKPTVWSDLGNDIHQTIITLSTDGIYEVSASCTDLSGRPSAVFKMNKIAIDKTAPAGLNITYSAPVREASIGGVAYQYYNGPVNVVVSANDDISGVSAFEYRFVRADGTSGVNVSIDTITIGQGQISYGNGNTAATYSFVLPGATLTANGQLNGTLEVRAINRSSLSSEVKDTKRIVADNLAPTLDVTYNDHVKEDGGIWYFNQAISASFSIGEANFYQEDFGFRVTKDGRDIASEIAWSNRPNDKHFGDFALSADGRYEVSMNYADRSGNAAPNYKSKAMIVDTVAPKVTITGISNQMASRDDTIGFVITIEDENLNLDEVTVLLQGVIVNEKGETSRINLSKEVEAQASQDGKSMTVVVTNLEKDAVYTVSCTALDKANNVTDTMVAENGKSYKKMVFSVNRNGSTYLLSEETEKFIGGFSKEPSDIVVTEINPTELKNIKVTLFKNDQTIELVEGTDYQVKKTGSIDTWYQYVYTVDKDVLRDDGVYRMAFYSEDRAGNVSNNTLDNKNVEISFAVDKTIPNVIITNLEEGVTYPVESLTVNIQASDNLKLVRGVAYLDGKECKTWDEQALSAASTGSSALSLDIKDDSVKARTLRVVVTDAAGNETEKVVSGFFVTTNLWIRYVNNKPLLFTSIGVVGVGSPSVAFLFRRRRRRFR